MWNEFHPYCRSPCGKRILWNMVPCDEEENYDDYVMSLCNSQGVLMLRVAGPGRLSPLSAEADRRKPWQLYNTLIPRYKAVLKTPLLEAYSWEYPTPRLLAKILTAPARRDIVVRLDAYCMTLERVTEYT
ncbi:class I adenylate cyclase [Shigella flexneri]